MRPSKIQTAILAVGLGLSVTTVASAAPSEGDSAYRWGRWAVLSPAAGAGDPYAAAAMPDAAFNARPGDSDQFDPKVTIDNPPPPPPGSGDDPRDGVPPVVIDDPRDRPPPPL